MNTGYLLLESGASTKHGFVRIYYSGSIVFCNPPAIKFLLVLRPGEIIIVDLNKPITRLILQDCESEVPRLAKEPHACRLGIQMVHS